jgi:DNA-binding response OmpR family regulator
MERRPAEDHELVQSTPPPGHAIELETTGVVMRSRSVVEAPPQRRGGWALVIAARSEVRDPIAVQLEAELRTRAVASAGALLALREPEHPPELIVIDLDDLELAAIGLLWQLRRWSPCAVRVLIATPGTPAHGDVLAFKEHGDHVLEPPLAAPAVRETLVAACARVRSEPRRVVVQVPAQALEQARVAGRDLTCWTIDVSQACPFASTDAHLAAVHDVIIPAVSRVLSLLLTNATILHDTRRGAIRMFVIEHDQPTFATPRQWIEELRVRLDLALLAFVRGTPASLPRSRVAIHPAAARS